MLESKVFDCLEETSVLPSYDGSRFGLSPALSACLATYPSFRQCKVTDYEWCRVLAYLSFDLCVSSLGFGTSRLQCYLLGKLPVYTDPRDAVGYSLGQVFGIAYKLRHKPWRYKGCQQHTPQRTVAGCYDEGQQMFDLIQDELIALVFRLEAGDENPQRIAEDAMILAMLSNCHGFSKAAVAIMPGDPEWPDHARALAQRLLHKETLVQVSFRHGPQQ